MIHRFKIFTLTAIALVATGQLHAQTLRLPAAVVQPVVAAPVPQTQADFIVAVVNSEPITNNEVRSEVQRVVQQLTQARRPIPDASVLVPEVLESLISQRAQLQLARETGLRVEESAIDQAEQSIAIQNQFDVAELRRRIVREGQSVSQFRAQLRDQLLLQRVRERDVEGRVRVSDQDVDQYLADLQSSPSAGQVVINLAQVLIPVPESATVAQTEALRVRAQRAQERAAKGEDFAKLVQEFSEVSDVANGGQLGLRTSDRYPESFVTATQDLSVGDVAPVLRSPAGFHVLKVVEKGRQGLPTMAVTQSHARHILLVPSAKLSEADARRKLMDFKKLVVSSQADFATLARDNSQDGSAANGGDLGWTSTGMFVPEFEATMNRLVPGEVSDPLLSRFGVHLIQLLERRKAALNPEQQREAVRTTLRDKKFEEAYRTWAQEVRARAYVEMRELPQ